MSNSITSKFSELPSDNFGVEVENDTDRRKLLWLVNQVGEDKLRKSAAKRNKYYPDDQLFVSVILKRFHLKVPTSVYLPVCIPIYWVYLLVLHDYTAVKVGITGNWPDRALAYVKTANYRLDFEEAVKHLFDADMSWAYSVESLDEARKLEGKLKKDFATYRVASPYERGLIFYGCGGHKEWFDYSIFDQLTAHCTYAKIRVSLNESLQWKKVMDVDLFCWH